MPDAGVQTASFPSSILEYLSTRVLEFSISIQIHWIASLACEYNQNYQGR